MTGPKPARIASSNAGLCVWSENPMLLGALRRALATARVRLDGYDQRAAVLDRCANAGADTTIVLCVWDACGHAKAFRQRCAQAAIVALDWGPSSDGCANDTTRTTPDRLLALLRAVEKPVAPGMRPAAGGKLMDTDHTYKQAEIAAGEILEYERLWAMNAAGTFDAARKSYADHPTPINELPDVMRMRLWHAVKNLAQRAYKGEMDPLELAAVLDNLRLWESVEYTNPVVLAKIARLLQHVEAEELEPALRLCHEFLRRRGDDREFEHADDFDASHAPPEAPAPRPKFAILVVEDIESEAKALVTALRRLARPYREQYDIQIIYADPGNAYADAVRKIKIHHDVQAVIADWDLRAGATAPAGAAGTGVALIEEIGKGWPWIHTSLLTGRDILSILENAPDFERRPFNKYDPTSLDEIMADIVQDIRARSAMPLFEALRDFSRRPMTVFHAMTISRGKTLLKSRWLTDFYQYYGPEVFNAETSTTDQPLDSLFEPKRTIRQAQALAARVFGAEHTFFVTNGTSTANKIVHQALLKPGDVVLIDRTCHKSHHYGLILSGAKPVYLQAEPLEYGGGVTDICKGITLAEILTQLESDKAVGAKMLCLSNCTFDGYVHDPAKIIGGVRKKLQQLRESPDKKGCQTHPDEFVFLFDEAWFGYARFVDEMREFTAMDAARRIPGARVYVTQSTHKTLTAFRQGSMIHVHDPLFEREVRGRFSEAMYTHASTSPNYSILASLDAGRMQADLEGRVLCGEAWSLAKSIRRFLESGDERKRLKGYFTCLSPDEMGMGTEFALDQTKLTIFLSPASGLSGDSFKKWLHTQQFNIQFNKTTMNTALLMVNAGSTSSSIGHLVTTFRGLASQLKDAPAPVPDADCDPDGGADRDSPSSQVFRQPVLFVDGDNDIRAHFFAAGEFWRSATRKVESLDKVLKRLGKKETLVSTGFVMPYPPGFPILLPGQIITAEAVHFLRKLGNVEIHGMHGHQLAFARHS